MTRLKNYVKNNKKKSSVIMTMLVLLLVVVCVIAKIKGDAKADVFEKDKDGNIITKSEINILEIVAQKGQQVLGYSVPGYEPISEENIENYHGDIDVEDFKNATGYVLEKSESSTGTFDYTVKDKLLNDAFNEKVLGDAMTEGQIIVTVCQANELNEDVINNSDLIFVNSNNYNNNLLYYYDQMVNNGENNIELGNQGAAYNSSELIDELRSVAALKTLQRAAGRKSVSANLTEQEFVEAGVNFYYDFNFENYKNSIAELQKGAFDAESDQDSINIISDTLKGINGTLGTQGINNIKAAAGKASFTEEEKTAMDDNFKKGLFTNYYEVNLDAYLAAISANTIGYNSKAAIQTMINNVNSTTITNEVVPNLVALKNGSTIDITDENVKNTIAVNIQKLAYTNYKKVNSDEYVKAFASESFNFSNPAKAKICTTELQKLIDTTNAQRKEYALNIIADSVSSDEAKTVLTDNVAVIFELAELEAYSKYNDSYYLDAINAITDQYYFKKEASGEEETTTEEITTAIETESQSETESETETQTETETETQSQEVKYVYDVDKMVTFIKEVNENSKMTKVSQSNDIAWTNAMAIYNYAMIDEKALMYDTTLLTSKTIGDYTTPLDSNTNNMYKFLLVLRQMRSDYFATYIQGNVDENGVYYADGLDTNGNGIGTGVESWYKNTFYDGNANYAIYREPEVVGDTYTEAGIKGASVNYVYKSIYSFTGPQFLGGEAFINGGEYVSNDSDIAQSDAGTYIYFDNSEVNYSEVYAHFWNNSGNTYDTQLTYDSKLGLYKCKYVSGYNNVLFKPYSGNNYNYQTNNAYINTSGINIFKARSWWQNSKLAIDASGAGFADLSVGSSDFVTKFDTAVDIKVIGSNTYTMSYTINGASQTWTSIGSQFRIGESANVGDIITVSLNYTNNANVSRTVTYKYQKIAKTAVAGSTDYGSTKTATLESALTTDKNQSSYFNSFVGSATKGDIIRYIMGLSINDLQEYPMKVLEIEPAADAGILNTYDGAVKLAKYLRIDATDMNSSNYKEYFDVTSMSVKEFNTRNDDLTSTYDLIYFGTSTGHQILTECKTNDKSILRTKYQDSSMNGLVYTGIGDRVGVTVTLSGTAASDYTKVSAVYGSYQKKEHGYWTKYFFSQFIGNDDSSWNLEPTGSYILKNQSTTSRLSGNDITVKKMNLLLDYLKAGFPILMDDNIINCDSTEYTDYNGDYSYDSASKWRYVDINSKMYNFVMQAKALGYDESTGVYTGIDNGEYVFIDEKGYASLVAESTAETGKNPDSLPTDQKFNGGLNFATKRNIQISFTYDKGPTEYTYGTNVSSNSVADHVGTVISKSSTEYTKYEIKLKINSNVDIDWLNDNYGYQMYIDKSGTGKFEDQYTVELDPVYEYDEKNMEVVITGNWPGNMDGFIPWKVEAYNMKNAKNHFTYTGYSAFENQTKKDVHILWVKTNNLNYDFSSVITNYQKYVTEYNLILDTISYKNFVKKFPKDDSDYTYNSDNTILKVKNFSTYDKSNEDEYDMIVFGFCDSYSNQNNVDTGDHLDINRIMALKNIEYFVDAGHSLLFAHDQASYNATMNNYTNTSGTSISQDYLWARYTTAYMRSMLGMDLYGATFSPEALDPESDEYNQGIANSRKYLSSDLIQADLRGYTEGTTFKYTTIGGNQLYTTGKNSTSGINTIKDWVHTKHVMRVNKGQVSTYPFALADEISVATTHMQYMQLNQEDADTTVWYTLDYYNSSDSPYYNYTKGDGSNNYYIYSKGNITYTGAGHSTISGNEENMLFVNTMVAAIKAGNFKPEVAFPTATKNTSGKNIVYAYDTDDGVDIAFKPVDYDSAKTDKPFTDCKIFFDLNKDGFYNGNDILLNDPDHPENTEGTGYMAYHDGSKGYNIVAQNLVNKNLYTFKMRYDVEVKNLLNDHPELGSIYNYPIVVQVTDNGTKKNPDAKTTVSNSIWVVKSSMYNLN